MELLAAMAEAGVRRMVFSSTAAVYGTPQLRPIKEDFPHSADEPLWRIQGDGGDGCCAGSTRSTG